MTAPPGAAPFVPDSDDLSVLARAAQGCQGCELYRDASGAVFGAGSAGARLMMVGEQPGDAEDRAGHPFVGPAGRILDQALARAGIDRSPVDLRDEGGGQRSGGSRGGRHRSMVSERRPKCTLSDDV